MGEPNETTARLTEPQKRHLLELYGNGEKTLYWRPANTGEQRCAEALQRLGLLAGGRPISWNSTPYHLNTKGRRVAAALALGGDTR